MPGKPKPQNFTSEPANEAAEPSRRHFLFIGMGFLLTGCASQGQQVARTMPGPMWRPREAARPQPALPPRPTPSAPAPEAPSLTGVLPRSQWAGGQPIPSRMNRMTPIHSITVHHDGMSVFHATDERSSINRLELIRTSHRDRRGWGDIGYHYAIDRAGRVWEGRPIAFQGAHVANHNAGNIGVVLLGNFDQQTPSTRQLEALNAHLIVLMRAHRVPPSRITTHREWETAATACPGASLQVHMDAIRRRGLIG